jgi:tetratricopeptide (TPR) repeat protein
MRRIYSVILALAFSAMIAQAQTKQTATPRQSQTPQQTTPPRTQVFDLSEVGVQVQPEPRLIIMMAALDAAGFDPTPRGEDPSVFRAQVRKDQANLDPDLKKRMASFFERNKLRAGGKELPPAQQAARYVSLAYALGNAPEFEAPARTDDLPGGLLEVLDFAPLVREFYRKSGIDERMPVYMRMYQAEGDRLRRPTIAMVRNVLSYLNTRPITSTIERIPVTTPTTGKKKDVPMKYETREHVRHFVIVPDLLAAPGAINFRVIADDYSVTVPYCDETKYYCPGRDNNPASPELRRAYIQYVIDPLVIRFNREIIARKEQIKQLLDARTAAGAEVSPDILLTVARSLTAATDARLEESTRLDAMTREARNRLDKATDAAGRAEITKSLETARLALADEVTAELAESYESGAVLDFYFAEQLRGVESSGFDISNSLADMINSFDPAREAKRLDEADAARKRAVAARKARESQEDNSAAIAALPNAALVKQLLDVDEMVRLKNYAAAEERLLALLRESPNEPRIYFALGETASLSAVGTTDEDLRDQRLNKALTNYRNAIRVSTPDTDRCLLARAHEAMGRILKFQDQKDEALKEFDTVLHSSDTSCDAYGRAVAGKKELLQPQ